MTATARAAATGSVLAVLLTAHTAWNMRHFRRPDPHPPVVAEPVSALLPVRDEAERVAPALQALLAQVHVPDLEIVVLDDGSVDSTADVVRAVAADDPRVRLLTGPPLPEGWLGKPHACAHLAEEARGSVLVFLDADVVLEPRAVAAAVALLRTARLDVVCPYPRQLADGVGPRLVQPLLQWSFLTTLPLRLAETSTRPSLTAGNGQFLVVDAAAYRRSGGHTAVGTEVLEDVALVRRVKQAGGRGGVVDGTALATCRMYGDWAQLREGYAKSLWAAFGSVPGAAVTMATLLLAYVVPPVTALLARSRTGAVGYAAAVAGRWLVARRTGQRVVPDVLAHPVSVLAVAGLTADSLWRRRRGSLTWKGRPLP